MFSYVSLIAAHLKCGVLGTHRSRAAVRDPRVPPLQPSNPLLLARSIFQKHGPEDGEWVGSRAFPSPCHDLPGLS